MIRLKQTLLAAAIAAAITPAAHAASAHATLEAQVRALAARVADLEKQLQAARTAPVATAPETPVAYLDQKVRALERRFELADEDAAKKKAETPVLTAGDKGFALSSADQAFQLKLRGYAQFDGRFVYDDVNSSFADTFVLRRVRPIFEGTLYKYYGFRIMPDFGGGTTALQDAYLDANYLPELKLRIGKFKPPVGLERLQSGTDIRFVERGLPTNLVPNRDLGIQVGGDLFGGIVNYAAGYFNGVPDGGSADLDVGDDKEFAGRVIFQPWKNVFGPLQGLSFGVAGSAGDSTGTLARTDLGAYRSQAQQSFFSYRTGATLPLTAVADGAHYRISLQGTWYWKSFGLLGEYAVSGQDVKLGNSRATLEHDSWQLAGSWVITGEENSYKSIVPHSPFDPWKGTWGAVEFVARYGELDVDDASFPIFANPATASTFASSWGLGVNWYLNKNYRLEANYENTNFTGGAAGGRDRPAEHAFLTRFQVSY
ncbi:MAG: OprO/OprP family phosphate-selective porin [Gammaproteobacteria bacterium]